MAFVSDVPDIMTPSVKIAYPQRSAPDAAAAMVDRSYLPERRNDRLVSPIADPDDIKYCSDDDDLVHVVGNLSGREAGLLWIAAGISWALRAPFAHWIPASREVGRPNLVDRKHAKWRSAGMGIAQQWLQRS
jgi:hypothetical protein